MKKLYFLMPLLLNASILYPQILICTFAYNRPDFIEIQYLTFKKFLMDDFKLVVFNDSREKDMQSEIEKVCQKYNLDCISIPQEIHTRPYLNRPPKPLMNRPDNSIDSPYVQFYEKPADKEAAVRNCNVCQYALDTLCFNCDDIIMFVDSDVFLIKEFNLKDYLQDCHAASSMRPWVNYPHIYYYGDIPPSTRGINYFWIGLIILNMESFPNKYALNLNRGIIATPFGSGYVDTAGYSYYLLQNIKTKHIDVINQIEIICESCSKNNTEICIHNTELLQQHGVLEKHINLLQKIPLDTKSNQTADSGIQIFLSGTFLHYRGASNWQAFSKEFLNKKSTAFYNFINAILEE